MYKRRHLIPKGVLYFIWGIAGIRRLKRFLRHVSIACYTGRCISYDRFRPSVRPSVTLRYHVKTTQGTITGSST